MLRVISGIYRGRKIKEPENSSVSRPTMDRIKESMFAILQHRIRGAKVLDLFAGSGSLGIESLSLGAKKCVFVDSDKVAYKTILENLKSLNENQEVLNIAFDEALMKFAKLGVKFDVILLDPPYDDDLGLNAIKLIKKLNLLCDDGVVVYETNRDLKQEAEAVFENVDERKYGQKRILFLKN